MGKHERNKKQCDLTFSHDSSESHFENNSRWGDGAAQINWFKMQFSAKMLTNLFSELTWQN